MPTGRVLRVRLRSRCGMLLLGRAALLLHFRPLGRLLPLLLGLLSVLGLLLPLFGLNALQLFLVVLRLSVLQPQALLRLRLLPRSRLLALCGGALFSRGALLCCVSLVLHMLLLVRGLRTPQLFLVLEVRALLHFRGLLRTLLRVVGLGALQLLLVLGCGLPMRFRILRRNTRLLWLWLSGDCRRHLQPRIRDPLRFARPVLPRLLVAGLTACGRRRRNKGRAGLRTRARTGRGRRRARPSRRHGRTVKSRSARRGGNGRRPMVRRCAKHRRGACLLDLLDLGRRRLHVSLLRDDELPRARACRETAGAAVVADRIRGRDHDRLRINVGDRHVGDVRDAPVVAELGPLPIATLESGAAIAVAVIDAAVKPTSVSQ